MKRLVIGALLFTAIMTGTAFLMPLLTDRAEKRLAIEHIKALMKYPESVKVLTPIIVRQPPAKFGSIALAVCGFVTGQNVYDPARREQRFVVEENEQVDTGPLAAYFENKPRYVLAVVESDDLRKAMPAPEDQRLVESRFEASYWNRYCVNDSNPWASHSGRKANQQDKLP